jgi:hypothetical protein
MRSPARENFLASSRLWDRPEANFLAASNGTGGGPLRTGFDAGCVDRFQGFQSLRGPMPAKARMQDEESSGHRSGRDLGVFHPLLITNPSSETPE